MRNTNTWLRSILALGAVMLVAGPGLVLAGSSPGYAPRSLRVIGPSTLAVGGSSDYTALVTFTDNSTASFDETGATFTALGLTAPDTFSGNTLTNNAGGTSPVFIQARYTNAQGSVTGFRRVVLQ